MPFLTQILQWRKMDPNVDSMMAIFEKLFKFISLCIFINDSQMCSLAYVCGGNSMGEDACKQVYLQNSIVRKISLWH